jgi:hypothetical protein
MKRVLAFIVVCVAAAPAASAQQRGLRARTEPEREPESLARELATAAHRQVGGGCGRGGQSPGNPVTAPRYSVAL